MIWTKLHFFMYGIPYKAVKYVSLSSKYLLKKHLNGLLLKFVKLTNWAYNNYAKIYNTNAM